MTRAPHRLSAVELRAVREQYDDLDDPMACEGISAPLAHIDALDQSADLSIGRLVADIRAWAEAKGWYDRPRPIPEDIALIHSEASEMLAEWRHGHLPGETYYLTDEARGTDPEPHGLDSELADVVIRCCDFAARHGVDLVAALRAKLDFNWSRPYRHGDAERPGEVACIGGTDTPGPAVHAGRSQ